ncbi:hypothetical protein VP01_397g2 [Puccinia sorghi]|uniref:Uncharacterized protein n=1 Tax=Puccinia sorghi TaxID=27349 RepID=A0A0L6US67_9BASI|nr:hypothetical protein VP01_397g2 [Puccinia sorghi]
MSKNCEIKASKRSVPFSKLGSNKRQFISHSSSYLARSSSKNQEEAASISDLLSTVGEKNRNLVEELDDTVSQVKENQTLKAQIDVNEVQRRRSRELLKKLTSKILKEKENLDENVSAMKLQLGDRLAFEKKQAEFFTQEISSLRNEIRESLEAVHNIHEVSGAQKNEILESDSECSSGFQDARKAVDFARELNEDRQKKQMVIDILRKELENKSGQVTEMSQRIRESFRLAVKNEVLDDDFHPLKLPIEGELEDLSNRQSIHMSKMEESWKENSQNIQMTVQRRTELILGRLDDKYFLEEERLHATIEVLEKQVSSQKQASAELSNQLEVFRFKLGQAERSFDFEKRNNSNLREESSKLINQLSCAEAKRCLVERLTSRLAKENFKLETSKSKLDKENVSLNKKCVDLSEDVILHQNLHNQVSQDRESLKLKLKDQESVTLALRACEDANESSKMELRGLKQQIEELEENNVSLKTEKACRNLHLSECHLKIAELESKQKEMISISIKDSNAARHLHHEAQDLKEKNRSLEAHLEKTRQENRDFQKLISSKEDQVMTAAGSEAQLKVKIQELLASLEKQSNEHTALQYRLDCAQSKWEDSRNREDLATGEVNVLRENLKESRETQDSLNNEIKKLQERIVDFDLKSSEVEMVGELRHSKDTFDRLAEKVNQQIHKREEFDQLLNERLETEKRLTKMYEETTRLNGLLEKHVSLVNQIKRGTSASEKEEGNLQARLKKTQAELERSQVETRDLKASNAVQASTAAEILQETEKRASEARKEAVGYFACLLSIFLFPSDSDRGLIYRRVQPGRRRSLLWNGSMNCFNDRSTSIGNEKKRLAKQLGDSESRLLAMSAELAKAKGKPSLEEIFSSSEHNDRSSRPPPIKKRSETIGGLIDAGFVENQVSVIRCLPLNACHSRTGEIYNPQSSKRESHGKIRTIAKKTTMASEVGSQTRNDDLAFQAAAIPRSSRRAGIPATRSTRRAGVKKQNKRA